MMLHLPIIDLIPVLQESYLEKNFPMPNDLNIFPNLSSKIIHGIKFYVNVFGQLGVCVT